jgi:N-acetylglucosamine kinase-like BadF-type ATPase
MPAGAASRPAAGGELPAVLAIDGGNSKTDAVLVAADGTLLASARGPGVPGVQHLERTLTVLAATADDAAAAAGLPAKASAGQPVAMHISACVANADLPEEELELARALRERGWSDTVQVANDTFAVLRAGLNGPLAGIGQESDGPGNSDGPGSEVLAAPPLADGAAPPRAAGPGQWGVAVTCGAGINCVGVSPAGRTTGYLALGWLTGDWGGGSALAQEAIWWAARAEDGRGPQTRLREAVIAKFGVTTVRDVSAGIHLGTIPGDRLLDLAPVVFEAAGLGDRVATDVVHRLGDEICVMAVTVIRRLGLSGAPVPVVLGGSVLTARDPLLIERIRTRLAAEVPGAEARIVDVPPVAGAALLGLDQVAAPPGAEARLREAYPVAKAVRAGT